MSQAPRSLARPHWLNILLCSLTLIASPLLILTEALAQEGGGAPRAITPRGELAADEKSTIDLFERSRESVVYITTRSQVRDLWTRNVYSVPRGTGSGFIWDASGHVITNFHVIENASEALVKLADGRESLTLIASPLLILTEALAQEGGGAPRAITPRGELAADEKSTIDLFERSRESVVYITTRSQVRDLWTRNVYSVPRGTGSGFIWDASGHVITNFHVIENASEALVKLADGREFKASLVGVSKSHDLAVLRIKVPSRRPAPVPIGTSHDLRVGQKVYAIGNPFGLDWTLTTGIVSALDRSLGGEDGNSIDHLVQTDAAINPGNSGGPLLDSASRLIGVNTAIYSPSGSSAGIGFAVPVDTVNRVVPQLIKSGRYTRPALGVEIDEDLNRRLTKLLDVSGVVVLRVAPNSSAAKAGLTGVDISRNGEIVPGDIVTAVDGKPVDSVGKLLSRLDDYRVGDTVRLTVLRKGKPAELKVTLQPGA